MSGPATADVRNHGASGDDDYPGEVARSFRFRALTGETVSVEAGTELTLWAWSTAARFLHEDHEHEFQSAPHGFGDGALLGSGTTFSGELTVGGGTLRLAEMPLTKEDREYSDSRPWVGCWTDENERFDLLFTGGNWTNAEEESLHQLGELAIDADDRGIAIRPPARGRRGVVHMASITAVLPPLGSLQVMPLHEAQNLLPRGRSSLPVKNGGLRRMKFHVPGSDLHEDFLIFSNRSAVGVIRDPRVPNLDQPERLAVLQDLQVTWG